MADIRIKDLATLESASLTGDVFVIDGTTGTRKLSAFSPSFGGNATVTGTLTVNGTGPHAFSGALTINPSSGDIQQNFQRSGTGKGIISVPGTAGNIVADSAVDDFVVRTTSGKAFRVTTDGGNTSSLSVATATVSVLATTASTSTSTGALVVSGGVGIAQALFAGESAYFAGAVGASDAVLKNGFGRSANGNSYLDLVGDTTYTDYGLRMIRGSAGANAISEIVHRGTGDFRITTNEAASLVLRTAATAALTLTSAQQVQVNATTASTTTSSGALVVSGGVGVAGAIVAGSFIRSAGANNISLGADAGKNRIDAGGATDTPVRALGTADALTGIEMRLLGIIDGTSAPAATAGYAKLYVDSADGDLKVIFGDGTVKTIATDS